MKMNKFLFFLLLCSLNLYANKNWIEFDDKPTNTTAADKSDLKMSSSKSTLKDINKSSNSNMTQKKNHPDKGLINTIKELNNIAGKIQTKIKK